MNAIYRIPPAIDDDGEPLAPRGVSTPKTDAPEIPAVIDSAALFDGATEILIAHRGAHYRLKITRQGKLILNK